MCAWRGMRDEVLLLLLLLVRLEQSRLDWSSLSEFQEEQGASPSKEVKLATPRQMFAHGSAGPHLGVEAALAQLDVLVAPSSRLSRRDEDAEHRHTAMPAAFDGSPPFCLAPSCVGAGILIRWSISRSIRIEIGVTPGLVESSVPRRL